MKDYLDYLVQWIRDVVYQAHAKGVIIGISGGIDSAVVGALAKKAFPNDCLGLILPCHSQSIDQQLGIELCEKFNIPYQTVDLTSTYDAFVASCEKEFSNSEEKVYLEAKRNTKVRLRMVALYAYAQSRNYLVLGTDNADEWYIGYFTKHGDGGVDLAPIIHLTKGEVIQAAKELGVPEAIIKRPPTAGLYEGQTDEKEIGVSYEELDQHLQGKDIDSQKKERLLYLHQISEHKRNLAHHPKSKIDYKQ